MGAAAAQLTVGQLLPWATTFLKYADDVVNNIPEDDAALDWRPTDEQGGWYFSLASAAFTTLVGDPAGQRASWRSTRPGYSATAGATLRRPKTQSSPGA